jgi:hypothetical protein
MSFALAQRDCPRARRPGPVEPLAARMMLATEASSAREYRSVEAFSRADQATSYLWRRDSFTFSWLWDFQ